MNDQILNVRQRSGNFAMRVPSVCKEQWAVPYNWLAIVVCPAHRDMIIARVV